VPKMREKGRNSEEPVYLQNVQRAADIRRDGLIRVDTLKPQGHISGSPML